MLIGEDFDKIAFSIGNWELLEPNALIGDALIGIISIYFGFVVFRYYKQTLLKTIKYWTLFFFVFGVGFIFGGLGHLLYNYWGIPGKIPAWFAGIISTMYIELAMVALLPFQRRRLLNNIFKAKAILFCLGEIIIIYTVDLTAEPGLGLIMPMTSTLIGLVYALAYLGAKFSRTITRDFRFLWISTIVLFPSILFQALKINIHQYFDRNDFTHVLLIVNTILYFLAVRGYKRFIERHGTASTL